MPDINIQHFEELRRNPHSIDVEIDASQIASPQQDFPMMLETPNSSNSVLNVVTINELGEQLPTEIEGVANDKNWVHLKDLVQSITNRKIKIFYGGCVGKPAADSTYGSEAVWDANYKGVWHMNNDPSGSAPQLKDSTSNNKDGTNAGGLVYGDLINGAYGKATSFDDGTNDCYTTPSLPISSGITIMGRIKPNSNNVHHEVIGKRVAGSDDWQFYMFNDGKLYWSFWDGGINKEVDGSTLSYIANEWNFVTGTYDGTTGKVFLDGVQDGTTLSYSGDIDNHDVVTTIGGVRYSSPLLGENDIGEIRISNIARSNNYISTTHNNLNNPTATGTAPFYKSISKECNFSESLKSLGRAG